MMALPEGFMPFDRLKYEMAIQAAPPGTMIKMGDLEKDLVKCTTCGAQMEPQHTQFHKHPKKCEHCAETFDENEVAHEPVKHSGQVGAGTIGYTKGCQVKAL